MCLKPIIKAGGCLVFIVIPLVIFAIYWANREDDVVFPDPENSPYCLPWEAGKSYWCIQGVGGIVSHHGSSRYAYDFYMPEGTEVRAAREGKVVKVVQEHTDHGYKKPNNLVAIEHSDGTWAYYGHIQQQGSKVAVGDKVKQGQAIALSGHVGHSLVPHLHFQVMDGKTRTTLPASFADVTRDGGVPRMFRRYTSRNEPK
ncbi:MAG TPA: M23 family metallopeptidase [Candidatus Hydrogenedentes bacterium]|nr:MAG: Glycyl-glycine endopeptidase ALE-1 precursor [Candidatus Hydrogenedentes bacterium ADurb.Bin170]HNZ48486.1 M23 family metallopeptidase [Candidatus Hydrogenedentota bacterium]HOD95749.1 M23 family metallopeptidase [Candidatus Hydrogenedentota bacterium]HOR49763.1 M23 family metallopeptidase [Candidatus Hydrogenedentota bacterium]HPK25638.1 M23 family metallopeptidase [Candidatus Hydrogenedentota bacterium]